MISVVIPTQEPAKLLIPTLASLVPGAAAGIVREVVLVDSSASPDVAEIADAAGCEYLTGSPDPGARLRQGADAARASWLLFLEPKGLLQEGWTREVRNFTDQVDRLDAGGQKAATFRLALDGFGISPRIRETTAVIRQAITGRPRTAQGLLIHRRFYDALGGHRFGPQAGSHMFGRIGRGRLVLLRSQILLPEG